MAPYTDDQIYNDAIADQYFATGSCVGQVTSVRGVPCIDVPCWTRNSWPEIFLQT